MKISLPVYMNIIFLTFWSILCCRFAISRQLWNPQPGLLKLAVLLPQRAYYSAQIFIDQNGMTFALCPSQIVVLIRVASNPSRVMSTSRNICLTSLLSGWCQFFWNIWTWCTDTTVWCEYIGPKPIRTWPRVQWIILMNLVYTKKPADQRCLAHCDASLVVAGRKRSRICLFISSTRPLLLGLYPSDKTKWIHILWLVSESTSL